MKKIIIINQRRKNIQKQFDEAIKDMNMELAKGNECDIVLEFIVGKQVRIVEGYFDISPDCSLDMQAESHKWFNTKILGNLKIKY